MLACLHIDLVQYSRWRYAPNWFARCQNTRRRKLSRPLFVDLLRCKAHPRTVESSLLVCKLFFHFGNTKNDLLAGFPTSTSTVCSYVLVKREEQSNTTDAHLLVWRRGSQIHTHTSSVPCARVCRKRARYHLVKQIWTHHISTSGSGSLLSKSWTLEIWAPSVKAP